MGIVRSFRVLVVLILLFCCWCCLLSTTIGYGVGSSVDGITSTSSSSDHDTPRRSFLRTCVTGAISGTATYISNPSMASAKAELDQNYYGNPAKITTRPSAGQFYFPTITPPFQNRATYRYDLGRNAWALEQLLTFGNVTATIRTIVVKLDDGGLWVNGPQYPTGEYCSLLEELGEVKHIVVPCNALEHKIPTSAFVKKYPKASVWITPGQYGPFGSCGFTRTSCNMGYRVDGVLPINAPSNADELPPWADEIDMRVLYVSLPENAGPVSEAAFFHKATKTLITTDAVIYIPDEPPSIFGTFFDDKTLKEFGFWPKTVLQAVFLPLRQESKFDDNPQWPGYESIRGRLIRAPILRAFADARAPGAVREWVQSIGQMGPFDRILTSHFASPIMVSDGPTDFLKAFRYLDGTPTDDPPITCQDWKLLDGLNSFIEENNLGARVVFDYKKGCPP